MALDLAARLLDLAEEHGFRIWTAAGTCLLGVAQVDLGRFDEGLLNIRTGMDLYGELRSPPIFWPFLLFLTARASLRAGRPSDGFQPIDSAIGILSQGSTASILSEFQLVKGDLLAALPAGDASGDDASPEAWYRRAYDRAGQLDARMTQLRAATRLARLRLAEGQRDAAEAILRPVYQRFDEGFGTIDLRDARELLAGLGVGA